LQTRSPQHAAGTTDARQLAGGGLTLFGASIAERGLRLAATWFLATALGADRFGTYASVITVLMVVSALAPVGADVGILYFGARYRQSGDRARLKGALVAGGGCVLLAGVIVGPVLWAATHHPCMAGRDGLAAGLRIVAPAVVCWALLLFFVGILRSHQRMRAQALSFQLLLPAAILVGAVVAVRAGHGLPGALAAVVVAVVLAAAVAGIQAWRIAGPLVTDGGLKALYEPARWLRWSLPQSLESILFRVHQWADILMLTALTASTQVGLYRVAASLALLGGLPVMAVVTVLNPQVASLVQAGERARLQRLVRTATRWLVVLVVPPFMVVALLPDVLLALFGGAYHGGATTLRVLVIGQAAFAVSAPAMRLIPMSGRAGLNLVNHLVVVGVNLTLNALLIPAYGALGAAVATSATLGLWSVGLVLQARLVVRCVAVSWRSGALLSTAIVATAGVAWAGLGAGLGVRLVLTAAALAVFGLAAAVVGRTPADAELWQGFRRRWRRSSSPGGD